MIALYTKERNFARKVKKMNPGILKIVNLIVKEIKWDEKCPTLACNMLLGWFCDVD